MIRRLVELAEIEQHLTADDRVVHASVVWPKSGLCKQQLVGVLTLRGISDQAVNSENVQLVGRSRGITIVPQVSDLTKLLAEKLPPYALPATWVVLDSMPLLSSGKTDRSKITRWLEEMDDETLLKIRNLTTHGEQNSISGTLREMQLQQIWGQILNVDSGLIGLDQSFLSLGGDSISAMQVVGRCRAEGLHTTVQDILQYKTISALSPHIKQKRQRPAAWDEPLDVPFDLSPIQQMYFDAAPQGDNHFNQSFLLRLTRLILPNTLKDALELRVKKIG
jgi:aryl carrier-like protein